MRLPNSVATFLRNRRIDWQLFWLDVRTEFRRGRILPDSKIQEVTIPHLKQDPGDL